jgi:hypothetical protein
MNSIFDKRAIDLTAGEFADVIIAKLNLTKPSEVNVSTAPTILRGVGELAEFLKCSYQTAYKYIRSKRFNPAIKKEGRLYIIDTAKFLSIYGSKHGGRSY